MHAHAHVQVRAQLRANGSAQLSQFLLPAVATPLLAAAAAADRKDGLGRGEPGHTRWTHCPHCWLPRGCTQALWAWLGVVSGAQPHTSQGRLLGAAARALVGSPQLDSGDRGSTVWTPGTAPGEYIPRLLRVCMYMPTGSLDQAWLLWCSAGFRFA